jgi:hypothetical protein
MVYVLEFWKWNWCSGIDFDKGGIMSLRTFCNSRSFST